MLKKMPEGNGLNVTHDDHAGALARLRARMEGISAALADMWQVWRTRVRQRRQLARFDDRALKDLAIGPNQADFEIGRKRWQEETGLGRNFEIGTDCGPSGGIPNRKPTPDLPVRRIVRIDGRLIELRPVEPADKSGFVALMDGLSDVSRRLRFLAPKRWLSARELSFLTEVDQRHHVCWIAKDLATPDKRLVAEARYVELSDRRGVAEFAITVADDLQEHGLGRILMEVLGSEAKRHGIFCLRGIFAADNKRMLRFMRRRGSKITSDRGGVLQGDLPVAALTRRSETGSAGNAAANGSSIEKSLAVQGG